MTRSEVVSSWSTWLVAGDPRLPADVMNAGASRGMVFFRDGYFAQDDGFVREPKPLGSLSDWEFEPYLEHDGTTVRLSGARHAPLLLELEARRAMEVKP